jgi:hypothetical protein
MRKFWHKNMKLFLEQSILIIILIIDLNLKKIYNNNTIKINENYKYFRERYTRSMDIFKNS